MIWLHPFMRNHFMFPAVSAHMEKVYSQIWLIVFIVALMRNICPPVNDFISVNSHRSFTILICIKFGKQLV